MNFEKRRKRFFSPILFLVSLLLIFQLLQFNLSSTRNFPQITVSAQNSALNINYQLINLIHIGQKRLISSIIWIETLMNSDIEHYDKDDLNSWMYQRFNALIEIDPKFYEVYRYGGQYLSIVKDDEIGAEDIYRRGLEAFPNNFWLNFHAGFHYYFEMHDIEKALSCFEKIAYTSAARINAPYLASLTTKLKIEKENISEELFQYVKNIYSEAAVDSPMAKSLYNTLYALRCQLDLACLNAGKKSCSQVDLENHYYPYSNKHQRYYSKKNCALKLSKKKMP